MRRQVAIRAPAANAVATAVSVALLRIGQLARATGFTAKTLRYYEEVRLLQPAVRSESGYRLYGDESVSRLRFVRRAKGLGLALTDIRAILEISDEGRVPCEHVAAIIERDLHSIDTHLRRLRSLKRDLLALKARMSDALAAGAVTPGGGCPCFEDEDD